MGTSRERGNEDWRGEVPGWGRGGGAARDAGAGRTGRGGVVIVAFALLGYAVLLLGPGAGALARARWPDRAPRLAVAAWLALTSSAVVSVALGGLALVVPTIRVSADLAALRDGAASQLRPSGWGRAGRRRGGPRLRRDRPGHQVRGGHAGPGSPGPPPSPPGGLALARRHDGRLGAVVLDDPEAAAWCLRRERDDRWCSPRRRSKPSMTPSSPRSWPMSGPTSAVITTCWCRWPHRWRRRSRGCPRSGGARSRSPGSSSCWLTTPPPRPPL